MKNVLLVGSGKIGAMITELLANSGSYGGTDDYRVTVADRSRRRAAKGRPSRRVETLALDVADEEALARSARGKFAVLSAAPFPSRSPIANGAVRPAVHYFDLTEDVATTHAVIKSLESLKRNPS